MFEPLHWIGNWMGLENASGQLYSFWSGIFSDASILAVPAVILRHRNCHAKGCWRLGRHSVEGTSFRTCRRHHPEDHKTGHDIHEAWLAAKPVIDKHEGAK